MSQVLQKSLAAKIKDDPKSVVFVVGAGVTMGALAGTKKPTSWSGLIKDGLDFAQERSHMTADACDVCRQQLGSPDSREWISAAETLVANLGGNESGAYRTWLRQSVGTFASEIRDRSVLDPLTKLAKLGVLL
ncbi:MAG: hypothetical protein ACPG77_04025, partial [Nannocystaceae bacterium]